jgi:ParB family transcriptional regulator, chromosome partitioning protein
MAKPSAPRLGKGLGALLGEVNAATVGDTRVRTVSIGSIQANPFQPRRTFSPEELEDLKASIRENGLLQPPVVRPHPDDPQRRYQLVAGERRFRSVEALGWKELPVLIRDVDNQTLLILALVENLQRSALDPLEEAEGFRALMEDFGLTQAAVADAVGKGRVTVANTMRLLRLPVSVQEYLRNGSLSMGHARALLALEDAGRISHMASQAVSEGWTVRQVEARARAAIEGVRTGSRAPQPGDTQTRDLAYTPLKQALEETLGTRVNLTPPTSSRKPGAIEIPFRDSEELERLFHLLTGQRASDVVS